MFVIGATLPAQNAIVSGYITDESTGETLIGANVFLKTDPGKGTATNTYGFYSLSLTPGTYTLVFNYLGYSQKEIIINLSGNQRQNVALSQGVQLQEIVVEAKTAKDQVESTQMGTMEMPMENMRKLPALLGEVDVLKTIQLLPGVLSAGEGSAGFYVRGGGADQNLVLLDEAVVYNSGHLLGFFSVFNADAIKNTTLIKGSMPANYGGRLSSVVDIQMKEGNDRRFEAEGGIGLIASRITLQGPLVSEQSSFIVSARRTYALDIAQPFLKGTNFEGTNYYFYDLNAKFNYRFSDRDRLFLSTYFGRDVLKFNSSLRDFFFDLPYGNATLTLRWNHLFNDKLFMNVSGVFNDYDFRFKGGQADFQADVFSGVRDWNLHLDFDYYPSPEHQFKFGANYTYHRLTPNIANATDGEVEFSNKLQPRYALEGAAYILDDWRISRRIGINAGLRFSWFTQLGPYVSGIDGTIYGQNAPVVTHTGLEPRINLRWSLSPNASIKAGATWASQYLHLVSNSTSTLPADVWVPSSELIKPQQSIQYALGYFLNFNQDKFETALEVYYKTLQNQIDYRENYVNNIANDLEKEFVFGKGLAYGLELFIKKNKGRLTGWIGYTLSRTERTFPDINEGRAFPAVYDRTHDLSVVANYSIGEKWELGGAFVFGTGNAFTPVRSLYFINQQLVQEYGTRNSARIQDYHRLDLSATYTPKPKATHRFTSSWSFSIYNTYSRLNPFFIYYAFETNAAAGTAKATAYKVSLFPLIPSITWNFHWKGPSKKE